MARCLYTIIVLAICAGRSDAAVIHWTNPSGGLWSEPANWDLDAPTLNDTAVIDLDGTYVITMADSVVEVGQLVLGGATGTHSLEVRAASLTFGVADPSIQVNSSGVLGIFGDFEPESGSNWISLDAGAAFRIVNNGHTTLECRSVYLNAGDTLYNEATGIMDLVAGTTIWAPLVIWNEGQANVLPLSSYEAFSMEGMLLNSGSGDFHVYEDFSVFNIENNGTMVLDSMSRLTLARNGPMEQPGFMVNFGTLQLLGGTMIFGEDETEPASLANMGLIEVSADSVGDRNFVEFGLLLETGDSRNDAHLQILSGNAWVMDGLVVSGDAFAEDSLYVAAGCTLIVTSSIFAADAIVTGSGTIQFDAGYHEAGGTWRFTGGIYVSSIYGLSPSQVEFDGQFAGPNPGLRSLRLNASSPELSIFNCIGDTIPTDTLDQAGGTLTGPVRLREYCEWTEGTFGTGQAEAVTIPAGVTLFVATNGGKTLAGVDLHIEGAAIMQDSGVVTLQDSATVLVAAGGTLDVGPAFAMQGVGTLYNSGMTAFDPQGDTIAIDVQLINSTAGRTPGTIDVLSRAVSLGGACRNEEYLNILGSGDLIIAGTLENAGGIVSVHSGGVLNIAGAFINNGGFLDLQAGSSITGDGSISNDGSINRNGSTFDDVTNVIIHPALNNLAAGGLIEVFADTLTLAGIVHNYGQITIHTGTVLRVTGILYNHLTGVISGGGVLDVSAAINFQNEGTINPGTSPGTLSIVGDYAGYGGRIHIEFAGPAIEQCDMLSVNGFARFYQSILDLECLGGYIPAMTDTIHFLSFDSSDGQFREVNGTALPNGRFLEIAFGPNGIMQYVCDGDAEIELSEDSIDYELSGTGNDSTGLLIRNDGHCPLEWSAAFVQLTPPSPPAPPWFAIAEGGTGHLIRGCQKAMLAGFNGAGLVPGDYHGQLVFNSNDPETPVKVVPVTLNVPLHVEEYDIRGGNWDFINLDAALEFLWSVSEVTSPIVFNLYPGTYPGYYGMTIPLSWISGMSDQNTVTFRAAAERPTIWTWYDALSFENARHYVFDGINIVIEAPCNGTYGVQLISDADSNVFRNSSIYRQLLTPGSSGIFMDQGCDANLIENVKVSGFTAGMQLGGISVASSFNEVRDCSVSVCDYGMILTRQNSRIHQNDIQPGYPGSNTVAVGFALSFQYAGDTAEVYANRIHGFQGMAGARGFNGSQPVWGLFKIYNNFIYDWSTGAGNTRGIFLNSGARFEVTYNSIRMNSVPGGSIAGVLLTTTTSNWLTLTNNIIQVEANDSLCYGISQREGTTLNSDHNCITGSGSNYRTGRYGDVLCASLADWTAVTGLDLNSVSGDPGFYSDTNLHIDPFYSLVDSAGIAVAGITTDIEGDPRGDPPCIGADEYVPIEDRVDDLVIQRIPASDDLLLNWGAVPNALSYRIFRSVAGAADPVPSVLIGTTSLTHYQLDDVVSSGPALLTYHVRASAAP